MLVSASKWWMEAMAVSQSVGGMSQSSRRFLYGLNVAINVVLAVIVLGFAVWARGAKFDASSARPTVSGAVTEVQPGMKT